MNCRVEFKDTIQSIIATNGGIINSDSGVVLSVNSLSIGGGLATEINLAVDVKVLYIDASDGAKINITGRANKVIIRATTGSKVDLSNLICDDASVKSSLGAKVWLTAMINYWAIASSGAKIYYRKAPLLKFEKKRSTGGNVELIPQ